MGWGGVGGVKRGNGEGDPLPLSQTRSTQISWPVPAFRMFPGIRSYCLRSSVSDLENAITTSSAPGDKRKRLAGWASGTRCNLGHFPGSPPPLRPPLLPGQGICLQPAAGLGGCGLKGEGGRLRPLKAAQLGGECENPGLLEQGSAHTRRSKATSQALRNLRFPS